MSFLPLSVINRRSAFAYDDKLKMQNQNYARNNIIKLPMKAHYKVYCMYNVHCTYNGVYILPTPNNILNDSFLTLSLQLLNFQTSLFIFKIDWQWTLNG